MKTITLEEAYEILQDASAIVINDGILVYPSLSDLEGSEENEFMFLSWDEEGLEYELKFCEGDNKEVKVSGYSMFLYDKRADGDDDETQITILQQKNLESDAMACPANTISMI